MEIKQCILVNNDCYKAGKKVKHTKIVVHSTGANNPKLSRYVQPNDGILGDNKYDNDWNQGGISKCVHAFIGKDKDGKVRIYQTLPWDYRCWGSGTGKKGSYNDYAIQFEICEDALTDEKYFEEAFALAAELCAYLCKTYGIAVDGIVSHYEAYKLGYARNHGDCDHWLKKFDKDMAWFRSEVEKRMAKETVHKMNTLKKGSTGNDVTIFESIMKKMGYYDGGIDDHFGNGCVAACNAFQEDYPECGTDGKPDGSFGPKCWRKMFTLVGAQVHI